MTEEIIVYSTVWCPDCKQAKKFFNDHRIQYQNIDIEKDPEAMEYVKELNDGMRVIPTIVFPDGTILTEPSNAELAEQLGLKTTADQKSYDVIVVGAGPSGLTAALYLSREGQDILVIEKSGIGGQIGITQMLENYPGFDEGISGDELADRLGNQAKKFGVEILQAQAVEKIYQDGMYWLVETADGSTYTTQAVLLSTGARYRRLDVPGEEQLTGINVHYCATCDGPFYKGKKVLVIGGGNSGFEEGLFLTRFADQVDIVEFLPKVKASQFLQEKVDRMDNMHVTVNHEVKAFKGENQLEGIVVEDRETGEEKEWDYDGVFVFIGLLPNSEFVENLVDVDSYGFILTDKTLMTSAPGVFASGDVRAESTKQAAAAAGEGATVALMIRQYLEENYS
jgi:thioredoxin reductase (NADPH)